MPAAARVRQWAFECRFLIEAREGCRSCECRCLERTEGGIGLVRASNYRGQRETVGMGVEGPAESRERQWAWEFMSMGREQRCSGDMGICACRDQRVSESV